jgi:hypothetical protein
MEILNKTGRAISDLPYDGICRSYSPSGEC